MYNQPDSIAIIYLISLVKLLIKSLISYMEYIYFIKCLPNYVLLIII